MQANEIMYLRKFGGSQKLGLVSFEHKQRLGCQAGSRLIISRFPSDTNVHCWTFNQTEAHNGDRLPLLAQPQKQYDALPRAADLNYKGVIFRNYPVNKSRVTVTSI